MPKYDNVNFGEYFNLPNPGLRSYFERVVSGQPDEYRTPFYKGKSVQEICIMWTKHLRKIQRDWPTLYDFEIDLGKKVGPMSIMKPLSERMEDIDAYYDLISLDRTPIDQRAIDAVRRTFKAEGSLTLRSEADTVALMKKSTSSGSPYFAKRKTVLDKTMPVGDVYMTSDGHCIQELRDGKEVYYACAVLGWRGQEGGPNKDDVKQRVVWMFPFAANIKELQVYQPLIECAQRSNFVPAWVSMEAVDKEITALFDTKGANDLVICTDFSKFDQHFNRSLQDAAAQLLRWKFGDTQAINAWLDDVYPIKYHIPLAYDWGKIRMGEHGMASGSGGTNADETLAHKCLQHEAAISCGKRLNPHSQCLGDDGILSYPGITVDDVMRSYTQHGLEMNTDKQYASTQDCTYLRRWHHKDYRVDGVCVGVYSTLRAIGRLCEQERYYDPDEWGREMVALRQLSIIENVKYHPLREEFADFCMKGDKYKLGLTIPGFLDNIDRIAQKAIDHMPDFLGYTKTMMKNQDTGLSSWWIVSYLKSKR